MYTLGIILLPLRVPLQSLFLKYASLIRKREMLQWKYQIYGFSPVDERSVLIILSVAYVVYMKDGEVATELSAVGH